MTITALKFGVPFLLPDIISQFFIRFGIAPGNLSPNSYRHLIFPRVVFAHKKWPEVTDPDWLLRIYHIRTSKVNTRVYSLRPRSSKAVIAGVPNSENDWRQHIVFVAER